MEFLLGDVSDSDFLINYQLEHQIGLGSLPFPTMNKSGSGGDKTVVCKHWLRGLCKKGDDCDFLHVYDMTKMPECYFFSRFGVCMNKECQFLHVDPATKIQDCAWYARGFCRNGPACRNRHVRRVACQNFLNGFCLEGPDCKQAHPKWWPLPGSDQEHHKQKWICHHCKERGHKVQFCHKLPLEERQRLQEQSSQRYQPSFPSSNQPLLGNSSTFPQGLPGRGNLAVNPKHGTKMASGGSFSSRVISSVKSVPLSLSTTRPKCLSNKIKQPLPTVPRPLSSRGYGSIFSVVNGAAASCGVGVPQQVRFSHVDITNVPSFNAHRLGSTKDPRSVSSKSEVNRKVFTYAIAFAGTVLATTSAKYAVKTLIQTIGPSASTLALANLEVNLASIPAGKNVVFKWRDKPLFVRHRTQSMIDQERSVPLSDLRDPETDEQRVQDPKWLVCVGICTHLGCVPIADAGEFGGYYCPCHGSHFDFSGRIRKGPAPTNMEVPNYKFIDENTLLVG
ncbi:Cytochrome b-c1 complex subunit Rieske mitochondrial [Taenia crassiceps]|uniref:Cytochrome b-c1 complex subunit Rieske mitochondrial n=1 Tax=Taenia crassiceps TaxID=6207 RepID=A0ABR4QCQ4_9CEST